MSNLTGKLGHRPIKQAQQGEAVMLINKFGQVRSVRKGNTAGYTIDQTILIVAIIAILVTLIIISVGWQLINRTSGTKLASQLKQVEDANGQFYSTFRIWPHQSYSSAASAAANMLALTGTDVTYRATVPATQQRNFIPGFSSDGTNVTHNFSSGGVITQGSAVNPFGLQGTFLVVQFDDVPFSEVIEAERAIDAGSSGTADYAAGRLVGSTGASCITAAPTGVTGATSDGDMVNVCYAANLLQ